MAIRSRVWIAVFAVVIAAGVALVALPCVYRFAQARYDRILYPLMRTGILSAQNNLRLRGYQLSDTPGAALRRANPSEILFVGHIYPKNGYQSAEKPDFPAAEEPLKYLQKLLRDAPPRRVIFGGDSVWDPTEGALQHLAAEKAKMPMSRFILGNHEQYWQKLRHRPDEMKAIFREPFGYEDVQGIRLVYLHTVKEDLTYGLDAVQREFLASVLQPSQYRYALVFMHHALWAGDTVYVNKAYPDAEGVARNWVDDVLPSLRAAGVRGVFAGDGGWRASGRRFDLQGIPHYVTGWSGHRQEILPEWLSIELLARSIRVVWNALYLQEHYVRSEEPANP